jgi:hypothetical protein
MKISIVVLSILLFVCASIGFSQSFAVSVTANAPTIQSNGYNHYVHLSWQATKEIGFDHYLLQRSLAIGSSFIDDTLWQDLAKVDTVSTTDTVKFYSYSDYTISAAMYDYRLTLLIDDTPRVFISLGRISVPMVSGVNTLTSSNTPLDFQCLKNYPNPFNPTTTIIVELQETKQVSLAIYDLLGRQIESLVNGLLTRGTHRYQWDASHCSSGTFLCVLRSSDGAKVAKLILQK